MKHRVDPDISAAVTRKFPLQCTYLEDRQVPLAFFSDLVDDDAKSAMAVDLLRTPKPAFEPMLSSKPDLSRKRLRDFIGPQSWFLFQLIGAGEDWLSTDPATWNDHPQYCAMSTVVRGLPRTCSAYIMIYRKSIAHPDRHPNTKSH